MADKADGRVLLPLDVSSCHFSALQRLIWCAFLSPFYVYARNRLIQASMFRVRMVSERSCQSAEDSFGEIFHAMFPGFRHVSAAQIQMFSQMICCPRLQKIYRCCATEILGTGVGYNTSLRCGSIYVQTCELRTVVLWLKASHGGIHSTTVFSPCIPVAFIAPHPLASSKLIRRHSNTLCACIPGRVIVCCTLHKLCRGRTRFRLHTSRQRYNHLRWCRIRRYSGHLIGCAIFWLRSF